MATLFLILFVYTAASAALLVAMEWKRCRWELEEGVGNCVLGLGLPLIAVYCLIECLWERWRD